MPTGGGSASGVSGYNADRLNLVLYSRRYAQLLWRRWPVLVVCLSLGLGISIFKAVNSRDLFLAYSIVGVAPRVQSSHTSQVQYQEAVENYFSDQVARMNSPMILSKAAGKVAAEWPASAQAIYTARAVRGEGNHLRMNVQSTDFEHARRFAAQWAKEFKLAKDEEKDSAIRTKAESTREQLVRTEDKLRHVKSQMLEFMQKHNIASIKDFTEAAQQRLDGLISEYNSIKMRRQRLEALSKEEIASGALQESPRSGADKSSRNGSESGGSKDLGDPLAKFGSESEYSRLKFEVHSKQIERDGWLKTLKPKHPKMAALDQEIAQLQLRVEYALDMVRQKQEALVKSLRSQEATYPEQITALQQQVRDYAGIMHDYNKLKDEEKMHQTDQTGLAKSLSELEATISASEEQWKIEEAGSGVPVPIGPNRTRIVMTGFLAGLAAALALVYLLHRLDDRLDLAEDIERELEEPVLGQIPQLNLGSEENERILVNDLSPEDMFAESIRGVRSTILMTLAGGGSKVLVVTSAVPGDGKTTFTSNFAMTLAVTGAKVLLIDADLRRGSAHLFFKHSRETGLSDALEGRAHWSEVLKETSHPQLKLLTTGALPDGPGELVIGYEMGKILEEARRAYDYVIVDTPPLTGINDTFALVRRADGLIFVVRAGQTSMKFAKTALSAVRQREVRVLGVVLNGITADNPYYYYHYHYHAYYAKDRASSRSGTSSKGTQGPVSPVRRVEPKKAAEPSTIFAQAGFPSDVLSVEKDKIEQYKARRASQRSASATSDTSITNLPGPGETRNPAHRDPES